MSHKEFISGGTFTNDANPADIVRWVPFDGATYNVTAFALGRRANGVGDIAFQQLAAITVRGGVITIVGSGAAQSVSNVAGYAVTLVVVGNEIVMRGTGAVGHEVNWQGEFYGLQLGPF
jgi:hypothetical protein